MNNMRSRTGVAAVAALVAGLLIGSATPAAGAVEADVPPPVLLSLRLDGTTAFLTFRDTTDVEKGHGFELRERDDPNAFVSGDSLQGVPGSGRVATRSVQGVRPGVAYCASVSANHGNFEITVPSNIVCADPADPDPDLWLQRIEGEAEPVVGTNRNYWAYFTNRGANAAGTVVVHVLLSGPLELRRLPEPGTFHGLTCTELPPNGGSTGGFLCSGGTLANGERGQIPVLTRVTRRVPGTVYAAVGTVDGPDPSPSDNSTTLPVRGR